MPDTQLAIRAEGIGKRFLIGTKTDRPTLLQSIRHLATGGQAQRELWALRNVDIELQRGEVLGIIGANGAGKSTLLMLIAKILMTSEGTLEVHGKVNPFFHLASGLQPELTVQENIGICAALLGITNRDLKKRLPDIIEFSGLENYLFAKLGELSTGLAARVPFTTAIHADVDVLLVDEMLSVGDIAFQDQCVTALRKLIRQGKTLMIVSHNLNLVRKLCPNALYLKEGRTAYMGTCEDAIDRYTEDMGVAAPAAAQEPADRVLQNIQEEVRETGGKILSAIDEVRQLQKQAYDLALEQSKLEPPAPVIITPASPVLPQAEPIPEPDAISPGDKSSRYSEAVSSWRSLLHVSGPVVFSDSFLSAIWVAITAAMRPGTLPFLKAGDEVITTAYNYPGVIAALRIQELSPVLTDLNPQTFNLDVDLIERARTPKSRAVIVSHLAGTSAPMDKICAYCREKGLTLLELNHYVSGSFQGAALGSFGDIGACGLLHTIEQPAEWGILFSRKVALADIFSLDPSSGRMSTKSEGPVRRMVEVLGRIPKISKAGLDSSLTACRQIEAATPMWQGVQSEYFRFFSQFPENIHIPSCPGADISKDRFTIVLDSHAPLSAEQLAQKLIDAEFGCRHYLPFASLEQANKRMVNSRMLLERGITFDLLPDRERREEFFSVFRSLLQRKALS